MFYEDLIETDVLSDAQKVSKNVKPVFLKSNVDSNYEKYRIPFYKKWVDGKYYTTISVENYGSGQRGTKIRSAVSGARYPFLVGSLDEDLFFKVSEATGRNGRKNTLTLFYDSPEHYENHHFTIVSQDVKNRWQEKNLLAIARHRLKDNY